MGSSTAQSRDLTRARPGLSLAERCHEHGLVVRAIGDIAAFCPPLTITAAEIREMFARFGRALDETIAWAAQPVATRLAIMHHANSIAVGVEPDDHLPFQTEKGR